MDTGSWLFPDGADRSRMIELDRQLRPVRAVVLAVLGLALIACGPWLGWWTLLPVFASAGVFRLADTRMEETRRPEYALFAAWTVSELIMAASVGLSGHAGLATAPWLAIPVLTLGARFSTRGIALGVGVALALLVAVELGVDRAAVAANPPDLIAPATLIVCVAVFQIVLMRSEIRLRGQVVIDPLTGLLNRRALERRIEELEQQSLLTLQPVGLIVADLDHFKGFNDQHGHHAGDELLVAVASRLRGALRAFDFCYRTGGEEFVVILPGAGRDVAARLAEALRREVESLVDGDRRVTMSFGVAASTVGTAFHYGQVFADADAALYEAKRLGRNRVHPTVAAVQRQVA